MKKISIVLAILAVFLVFGCSNAAGPVDNAGNPVDLAGSWSGTVAYKADETVAAPAIFTAIDGDDVQGTWVKRSDTIKADKDYDKVSTRVDVDGTMTTTTTVTTKYLFNAPTVNTTTTRVINADGGYTETTVETKEYPARDAISAVNQVTSATANTTTVSRTNYVVYDQWGNPDYYYNGTWTAYPTATSTVQVPVFNSGEFAIPAYLGGTEVTTTTKTVTVTAQDDGLYTENTTTTVAITRTGDRYSAAANEGSTMTAGYTTETYPSVNATNLRFYELTFWQMGSDWKQTVKVAAKESVAYQNDVTETITFEVAANGTYTLTVVDVVTQAAADAAEETATHYAAPARAASTKTTTWTIEGTVAAWDIPATSSDPAKTKMVLSSSSLTTAVEGTGDFEGTSTPTVNLFGNGEYTVRFFQGDGKKDDTILTRMYVDLNYDVSVDSDTAGNIVILDKAPEAEE